MLDLNSIQETIVNKQKIMYEDLILKLYNKNKELEKCNQTLKQQCYEQLIKLHCIELSKQKGKNQMLTKVPQDSGYQICQFKKNFLGKKKQEFQLLTKKEQIQKEAIEFEQNQETEKKQKKLKELEKTPPKNIINQSKIVEFDDLQKNGLDNQFKYDVNSNTNEQQHTISKSNSSQNEQQQQNGQEQNQDLNSQNEKVSQKEQQQPLDHNNQLKNDRTEEMKYKIQHLQMEIQDLQNQILQKDKTQLELTQQIAQMQKAFPNSEDSTMVIEHIEGNQFQNGYNKKEQMINQNHNQIDQLEKELNEERRKNDDLIKSQQIFLQDLTKIYQQTKIKKLESEEQEEEEDDENMVYQEKKINQDQFLKEWKNNLQQLADEIGEYEENDKNQKQELQSFAELKQKYEELTMYYTEAYNRLGQALQQIEELNQEIDNKNSLLQEYSQQRMQLQQGQNYQNQDNQFQENNENDQQSQQEIMYLQHTIQQLQAQLDNIQQQDYYQRMNQILQEYDELKKIHNENLEDSQKKDLLIEELQQQLLTQSQQIHNQEKKDQQELQYQNDFNQ